MRSLHAVLISMLLVSCGPQLATLAPDAGSGGGGGGGGGGGVVSVGGGVGGGGGLGGGGDGIGGGFGGGGGGGFSDVGGGSCVGGGEEVGGGSGTGGSNAGGGGVVSPAHAPPPISGGTMVAMSNGIIAIGDSDRDQLYFVTGGTTVAVATLQTGDEPGRVVEGPSGSVFVALRATHEVAQIDSTSLQVTRFTACSAPRGLWWRADTNQLLVACSDGELATLDFSQAGAPALTLQRVADDLRDVVMQSGQVLVSTFRAARVYAVAADGTVSPWSQPSPTSSSQSSASPQVAWRVQPTAQGLAMIHQMEQTSLVPDPTICSSSYGSTGQGSITLSPALTLISGAQPELAPTTYAFFEAALPVDLAVSSDQRFAVAYAGASMVVVTEPQSPGLMQTLFVAGQPVSVAFQGSNLLVYSREPATLAIYDGSLNPFSALTLSAVSADSTGHDLFHHQTCASCHPEATDDGHVWSFTAGARRTPTLRGGLKGSEPFHWSGDELDFGMLMSDVFVSRMGGASEDSGHVQAVLDWLDVQPARPAPSDLDASAVTRGQASFLMLGCSSCHAGTLGTDNQSVDVGTGGTFQVPRLAELAYSAPFFHDGSIEELADRFTAAGGSSHTGTSGLTADQISDLVAYLRSR